MTSNAGAAGLTAGAVVRALVDAGVTHVVTVPDSETNFMYDALAAGEGGGIEVVPTTREGETIPIAAGLWIANQKPVVMIQNSGLFESGDAIRGLGLGIQLPVVMFIGYRGYNRHGDTPDSAAQFLEPFLHTWGVPYWIVETDDDLDRVALAFEAAEEKSQPVAVLIGSEYVAT